MAKTDLKSMALDELEDLLKNSDFNERVFKLVRSGGRE